MPEELTIPNPPKNSCLLSESRLDISNIFDQLLQRVDTISDIVMLRIVTVLLYNYNMKQYEYMLCNFV